MSEIVNLRRVRKAKTRAERATQADANRVKHGVPTSVRDLAKARADKASHDLAGRKLNEE